ncbi:phytoene desaturase family protein [Amycolatopsis sp. CA-230715]|uniref:phytoene desaturase family protein n=1 Tax=Amycolatopsis sp. CA-230715 TaxID=2745196 RepID=UPI001C026E79|nr:NAD(P)/FAD-dependent oxidoreductase [Amycolatopsis sp. CA-230715]QWF81911.1 hypothetical protein HUW46_05346 [Amycolatopsis sp. CA-230715]
MDVAIVGSGPNGLAAGVVLARAGLRVELFEAADEIGGGTRSARLFDPDVLHDVCSAVHPMAAASRFFREFDLGARGVELVRPSVSYAHPLDDAPAGLAFADLERTCERLGSDGARWRAIMGPLVRSSEAIVDAVISDQRRLPADPVAMARFGLGALVHGSPLGGRVFRGRQAPAMLAGVAAHAIGRLPGLPGGGISLLLGHLAHTNGGWPVPRGGSQRIADALADDLGAHGGIVHTGHRVTDIRELASARAVVLDVSPRGVLDLAGRFLPGGYRRALESYRYGPGVSKVDFLVSEPIPWTDPGVAEAGTVHLGGDRESLYAAENAVVRGKHAGNPFVLLSEPMVADPTRGLPGKRPVWAYCHVPNGSEVDATEVITRQIERFAPGFSDTVLASRSVTATQLSAYNPNYVGGDIASGAITPRQLAARPVARWDPFRVPLSGVYLCSAATPPGPGVHGLGGYYAAKRVLRKEFGRALPALGHLA